MGPQITSGGRFRSATSRDDCRGAYPKENVTPNNNNGWNNYEYVSAIPQNRWEATGKINYSFSETPS